MHDLKSMAITNILDGCIKNFLKNLSPPQLLFLSAHFDTSTLVLNSNMVLLTQQKHNNCLDKLLFTLCFKNICVSSCQHLFFIFYFILNSALPLINLLSQYKQKNVQASLFCTLKVFAHFLILIDSTLNLENNLQALKKFN